MSCTYGCRNPNPIVMETWRCENTYFFTEVLNYYLLGRILHTSSSPLSETSSNGTRTSSTAGGCPPNLPADVVDDGTT